MMTTCYQVPHRREQGAVPPPGTRRL